jgi:hypothetical protein
MAVADEMQARLGCEDFDLIQQGYAVASPVDSVAARPQGPAAGGHPVLR